MKITACKDEIKILKIDEFGNQTLLYLSTEEAKQLLTQLQEALDE